MIHSLWNTFAELVCTPFRHGEMIWGIVPLYFGLLLNEITSAKASFRTALQTGFSFVWAAAQWLYPYVKFHGTTGTGAGVECHVAREPDGHRLGARLRFGGVGQRPRKTISKIRELSRVHAFANYFMIAIFPIQTPVEAFHLPWTWERLLAIAVVRSAHLVGFALCIDAASARPSKTLNVR